MASSSTSSADQKNYRYDVFLSFRGEDTRKNFVDHLYVALQRQGINTFKDDERLEKGKRINDELLKSIEDSKFYIIVFSKNYASSSWCLDELVKIMECQKAIDQTAYPVFYDVDPSEVRKQVGAVGEAFARHDDNGETGKWREAMEEAANLTGWNLRSTADGHEAKLINKIVEMISLELRFINTNDDENLVGMESRMDDIVSSLGEGVEDVRMIGIKGIGGGGKTTLAGAIYDKISHQFEGKVFLENVREVSKASLSGLRSLQKQVISGVLNDETKTVGSVHDGKRIMKRLLGVKKVLIVLDDVDHLDQLVALAGGLNWFKPGSRVVITTRDEQVLIAHGVTMIHDVNLLSHAEAICLFSRYAFGRDLPVQRYKELSLQVVRYAAGLPLTIRVLGSFLCGKSELEWIDALERLKTVPLKETQEKLELSYTALEDDYKEIFLDVACLLKGWLKDRAIRALRSCGFHVRNGLRVLEQKSLITISPIQQLGMHDHLAEMGRTIVRRLHPDEPMRHSRLWIRWEIEDLLAKDLVMDSARAIATRTFLWHCKDFLSSKIHTKGFGNMEKLRFLHIDSETNSFVVAEDCQNFPNALRFLSWHGYPYQYLPKTFQADNLVSLEMPNSRIERLWEEGDRKVLKNLRFLDFSYSKLRTLDCGLFPNLEMLNLDSCSHLVRFHAPIGCLRRLVYLNLCNCCGFISLLFIKLLELLEVLDLSYLHLTEFPDILSGHPNNSLMEIKLSGNHIRELPSSIGNLNRLVSLDLSGCRNLKSLPQSICSLPRLNNLNLDGCAIEELPENFGHLKSLEILNIKRTSVQRLPFSIFKQLKNNEQDKTFLREIGEVTVRNGVPVRGLRPLLHAPGEGSENWYVE